MTWRVVALGVAIAANCLDAVAQESQRDAYIDEIVVTAQKRLQSAQEVPVSVLAISGAELEKSGIESIEELSDLAAGVEIVSLSPGAVQMVVRGVTNLAFGQLDSTAAVGYYIDETPISSFMPTEMPDTSLWDVERVEVLRGPQGTLFGESSMGGTIRIITRRPDPLDFGGTVIAGYESATDGGSGYSAQGILNVPLVDEKLALRLNLSRKDLSGRIDIPDLGLVDADDIDMTRVQVALGWTPNEQLNVQFSYLEQETNLVTDSTQTSSGRFDPLAQSPPGMFGPVGGLSPQDNRFQLVNITVEYDFDRVSLVSATSFFDLERAVLYDNSFLTNLFFGVPGTLTNSLDLPVESFTQELRLSSGGDQGLSWTVGAFFQSNRRGGGQTLFADLPDFGLTDVATQNFDVEIDSYALFGQLEYRLGDLWSVQLGGRYYADDRTIGKEQLTDSVIFGLVAGTVTSDKGSANDFAPSLGISWSAGEHLLYARVAKGFRSGGINDNVSFDPAEIVPTYGSEELWSYEIGSKNLIWDGKLQLNGYIYMNRWDDIQLSQGTSDNFFYTVNAGKAESFGGELELVAAPIDDLTVRANFSLTDAEIREEVTDPFGNVILSKGNKIPLSPDTTFSLSADYSRSFSSDLTGTLYARYAYRSSNFSDAQNFPEGKNESNDNVFISLGLEKQTWGVYASVINALDEDGTVYRAGIPPVELATFVQPRTYQLEVRWSF